MAETTDMAAAAAAAGTFLGGLWAALKFGRGSKQTNGDDDMTEINARLLDLERRADDTDKRFSECFALLGSTRDKLADCHTAVSVVMARLEERRK